MAIRGVNLSEKEDFIHPDDPGHPENPDVLEAVKNGHPVEKPTVYHLGNLTANDRVEFGDMSATPTMRDGGITMAMRNVQKAYAIVQRGLKGWDNMQDSDGKPVEFKTSTIKTTTGSFVVAVADECMVHLPHQIIMDLSNEIQRKNGMVSDFSKKSEERLLASAGLSSEIGDAETSVPSKTEQNEVA